MPDQAIDQMVRFWKDRLLLADKRATFGEKLRTVLRRTVEAGEKVYCYVDYDPNEPLLEALHASGIECKGFMFSADGIFSCRKTGTWLHDGVAKHKEGYGAKWEPF